MENMIFDPMSWAAASDANKQSAPTTNEQPQTAHVTNATANAPLEGELAKAQATCDELLRIGANIAESYEDYLQLGFALAEGLGADGRDIYHRLCALSSKYEASECERKWQECLLKHDGRTTIASFYKMAQQAGADLSAISHRFPSNPSNPSNPSLPSRGICEVDYCKKNSNKNTETINNQNVTTLQPTIFPPCDSISNNAEGSEGFEGFEGFEGNKNEEELADAICYVETFSDKLDVSQLPLLIREPFETQDDAEGRDKIVLSALTLYSGVLPNVYGVYDQKRVYPPFYTLIDAPSGADKGVIAECRNLLMPVEMEIRAKCERQQEDYLMELAAYNALDKKQKAQQREPQKPPYKSVFIPANSSATAAYQALADNGEWGVIFETEADTLSQALKQDYGNYSDGLRKAYHHEMINYNRRKDDEHVSVSCPRLAALLTCTPGQVPLLLSPQQMENGLANRFLFYNLRSNHSWRDVFAQRGEPLSDQLQKVGERFLALYHELQQHSRRQLQFVLSVEQKSQFNDYFKNLLGEQIGLHGEELDAFVKRLGLATFRLAMVLSILRCADNSPMFEPETQTIVCSAADFKTAMTIADCLINHTAHVYANLLPHDVQPINSHSAQMSAQEKALYMALPDNFTTLDCQQTAQSLHITWKTAERYLGLYVSKYHIADRLCYGHYKKKV